MKTNTWHQRIADTFHSIFHDILKIKWALLILAVYGPITHAFFDVFCPLRAFCGLPCPGCGMSRAAFYIFQWDFETAFNLNPAIYLWIPYIIFILWNRYVIKKHHKAAWSLCIIICILTIVNYVILMVSRFPYIEPCVYHPNNLLARLSFF